MTGEVEVDTSGLDRGVRVLEQGLESAGRKAARDTAAQVADRLRGATPVLTGRLRSTVSVSQQGEDSAVVRYGGSLPYARYIANRSNNLDKATQGQEALFQGRCQANAREVCSAFQ